MGRGGVRARKVSEMVLGPTSLSHTLDEHLDLSDDENQANEPRIANKPRIANEPRIESIASGMTIQEQDGLLHRTRISWAVTFLRWKRDVRG